MKLSDLQGQLGARTSKEIRDIIHKLGYEISPSARTVPDDMVDEIVAQYKEDHAPLLRRSMDETDTTSDIIPTKDTLFSLSKKVEVEDEEDRKRKKREESREKAKKKKEEETRKAEEAQKARSLKKVEGQTLSIDDASIDLDIDLGADDTVQLEDDEEESVDQAVERVEREEERLVRKSQKKVVRTDEDDKDEAGLPEHKKQQEVVLRPKDNVIIPELISVKEFSEKIGVPAGKIIAELLKNGVFVTINHKIDFDTASLIATEFGLSIKKEEVSFSTSDLMIGNLSKMLENEDPTTLSPRAPIVSIMGHVDHGKTSLLDYIRKSKVVATEAGGITQSIGAYQVDVKDQKITFLDTPGHEAFTAMRARGAKATDIAVLVVAADEGVKPQTIEAINHAREAGIPIIVAMNKIDKEGAQIDKLKAELAEHNLVPEDWGGDTIMAPISAKTGQGIDELLDMIILVAEMQNLRANPDRLALGTIIEAHLDPSLGPVATVLVSTGTLNLMDNFVVGEAYGRVKIMQDSRLKRLKSAEPSTPVRIAGFSETPHVGDILQVTPTERIAREKAVEVKSLRSSSSFRSATGVTFNDLISRIGQGELKQLKIVLKADTKGSLEAVRNALLKLNTAEVEVTIIHSGVGNVTETDVLMASAAQGLIIGFNVSAVTQVEKSAEKMNVTIKNYRVIYHLTEEIASLLTGMLDPELREIHLGDFEVMQIFYSSRKYMIIGGRVMKGKLESKAEIRVIRGDKLVGEGRIDSIQKGTESVSEIGEGHECGIRFVGKCTPEPKDIFEVYKIERIERTL